MAITTTAGQKELHSDLLVDVRRAEQARALQERIGLPSDSDIVRIIDSNLIKNIAVTRRDVKLTKEIFGTHTLVYSKKGQCEGHLSTKREDITEVPKSIVEVYGDVTLCIDVFMLNGIHFFHSISRHIQARTTNRIRHGNKDALLSCIKAIAGQYALIRFRVTQVHGDNQFECLKEDLISLLSPIQMFCVPAKQHEPTVE